MATPWHPSIDLNAWQNAEHSPAVIIANGSQVKVTIRNGQLSVSDGPPDMPRTRTIPRIPRTVTRLIILAGHGYVTVESQRWMKQAGISWAILDSYGDDNVLAMSGPGQYDARLLRAQSHATSELTGLQITRYLLDVKMLGQAQITEEYFQAEDTARYITARAETLSKTATIQRCTVQEGLAAESYWQAWTGVQVPFSAIDARKIPGHWRGFTQRASLAYEVMKNRGASDPISASLNYLYKVGETEAIHALHAAGLSPVLGIIHMDKPGRDSMALDLLETIRPSIDRIILDRMMSGEKFPRLWCRETSEGICRLEAPYTHYLCSFAAQLAEEIAPHARHIAEILVSASPKMATVPRYKDRNRTPKTTRHVGYPAARLKPGVTVAQIIPDDVWREIGPILPAIDARKIGRPSVMSDRTAVAALTVRYVLKCPWAQVPGNCHRSTVNDRWKRWQADGIWDRIRGIVLASGHLTKLAE